MKKALVLAIVCALGLGVGALAAPLAGTWTTSFSINPNFWTAAVNPFSSFSTSLKLAYTLGGWTFGSTSTFGLTGFSSQKFSAGGTLGAFTLSSEMAFAPMLVTVYAYPVLSPGVVFVSPGADASIQTPPNICTLWVKVPDTYGPAFLYWKAIGSVSIAGVTVEGLIYQNKNALASYVNKNGLFLNGTGTLVQTDSTVCATVYNGLGARLTFSGSFDTVKLTSRTYFNLTEYTLADYYANILGETLYCPSVAKSGYYFPALDNCDIGVFTEEYITAENFTFGCVKVDVGLSIDCTHGFSYIMFVAKDINIGNWLSLTASITFTTTSKTVALCANLIPWKLDCFTIEIGVGEVGTLTGGPISISSIDIHGFAFSYKFNGVTFAAYTELDEFSTMLGSDNATWNYVTNPVGKKGFLVPYFGKGKAGVCADYYAFNGTTSAGTPDVWQLNCVAAEQIKLWEKWTITFSGDACCGGAVTATINNYFGDLEELCWYGYGVQLASSDDIDFTVELYDTGFAAGDCDDVAAAYFTALDTSLDDTTLATHAHVYAYSIYADSTQSSLFDWAKTDIAVKIGLGSNFSLNLGMGISAYGWGSLDFGFTFTF